MLNRKKKLKAREANCKKIVLEDKKITYKRNLFQRTEKNNPNKTDVYHIDSLWRLDVLDLKDYGPENNKKYRYVLIVIDSFSKFGWIIAIRNKIYITKETLLNY